jgi:hypothetical protein
MISEEMKQILDRESKLREKVIAGEIVANMESEMISILEQFRNQAKLENDEIKTLIDVVFRFGQAHAALRMMATSVPQGIN